MGILNILLAALLSLGGLPAGFLIAKMTKEELKQGKKYFFILQSIILIIAMIFVLYSYHINFYMFLLIGLIIAMIIIKVNIRPKIGYPFFTILFLLSAGDQNLLILTSSMIFLYGIPTASLIRLNKITKK